MTYLIKPSEGGKMQYVYILRCVDNQNYIGCTNDLKLRLGLHRSGKVASTRVRLPVQLAAYFAFTSKYTAYKFEKYLKTGSGRAFARKHFF